MPDLHLLTGAYALDALEHPERADFERHLHTCPTCRLELGDFAEAAASLADRVAVPPPPELRERVLREVSRTRQASPTGRLPMRHPVLRRGLLSAAAAVLIAVSAGSVGVAWQDHRAADRANVAASRVAERAAQVSAVLSDPARTEIVQPATQGGTATVVTAGDKAVLITSRLPDPPPGKTYQVWLFDKSGMRSVELLATRDGYGQSLVSGITAGASVAVSVEPAGGSRQPTTTPVLNVPIA